MNFAIWLAATVLMFVVRAPHVKRSLSIKIVSTRETRLDRALVALVSLGLVLPLVGLTGVLGFADVAPSLARTLAGVASFAVGLWLLHRAHVELGAAWSNTLELREGHRLVTTGVYARLRHPMYVALILHGVGQALVLPNLIAGPAFLIPFAVLVATRIPAEERMMSAAFGPAWAKYVTDR